MTIISLVQAIEMGHKVSIKSGILCISQNIHLNKSKEQKIKLLEDIGRLEIQSLFMIDNVKTCNANVANGIRKPTLSVNFTALPYTRGCHPHAWFNIELSEKNPKRWHAPVRGAFMDLIKMIGVRCPSSKASEHIGKLKRHIYTAKYHPDIRKKDKIVNSSIMLADIRYEHIVRAIKSRNSLEEPSKKLRNNIEIYPKINYETSIKKTQRISYVQDCLGTCNANCEEKCTRNNESSYASKRNPIEQTNEEWLDEYGY